jgi:PAS domain S-box-containing protein
MERGIVLDEHLKRYPEGYQSLIKQASDGILNVDQNNTILEFNRKCEEIFQYARDETIGKQVDILIPERFFQNHNKGLYNLRMIKEFERSGRTIEIVGVKKDGTEFPMEISFFFLKRDKPYIFTAIIRDITKRKETERRITRQNQELFTLNSITQAISQSLDLDKVLYLVMEKTLETLKADDGVIFLRDESIGLRLLASKGVGEKRVHRQPKNKTCLGHEMIDQVIQSGEIAYFSESSPKEDSRVKWKSHKRIKSLVTVPLKSKDKLVGVMAIGAYRKDFLNEEEFPLLHSIGSVTGVAIENVRLFQELKLKNMENESEREKLKQLTKKLIQAQEEERKRVSRELHDEVGQLMFTLKINLEIIKRGFPQGNTELKDIFDNAMRLVDQTASEIRTISSHLHPSVLDALGLIPAIKSYIEDCKKRFNTTIEFNYAGFEIRMDCNLETVLYRSIQESLTNVWKHSEATHVKLNLVMSPTMIIAVIKDNGKGFNTPKVSSLEGSRTGLGILGIRERVALVGGKVKIKSNVGSGTTVRIEIPV